MGVLTRAVRNILRRKIRALLVIIALGFSLAIMIAIPAGISVNQASTLNLSQKHKLPSLPEKTEHIEGMLFGNQSKN